MYRDVINRAEFNRMEREWEQAQERLPGGPGYEESFDGEWECPNLTTCERSSCYGCPMNKE